METLCRYCGGANMTGSSTCVCIYRGDDVFYICNLNVPAQICKDFYKLSETSVYRHSVIVELLTLFSVLLVFFSFTCIALMITFNLIFTSLVSTHMLCL